MKKEKLYFQSEDSTTCEPLDSLLDDARFEGLEEITVIEAIPDNNTSDHVWCTQYGEVTEKSDCKKSVCRCYESKSGRGKCSNRGNLYLYGEEVTFKVDQSSDLIK